MLSQYRSKASYNPIDFEVAVNAACKDPKLAIEFIGFMIRDNTMDRIDDTWVNLIVQGKMEDAENVLKQVQDIWSSANGQKVEERYDAWYQENKDSYMFTDDVLNRVDRSAVKSLYLSKEISAGMTPGDYRKSAQP